ncbi:MAG: DUF2927 domain-containing protein [Gemmobacter sp.]|uniref:DUF2927 domain-containing protein n=1 Tax=Gemmobacter sp. TaxID=1898957 RepID=UPI00391A5B73
MRRLALLSMLALSGCVTPQSTELPQRRAIAAEVAPSAQPPATFAPQAAARVARSNASVAADFMDLTFRMESGRSIETFSRFEGPVRVAMTGQVPATAQRDLSALLGRLRAEAGIDIAQTADAASAGIVVQFLPRATMKAAVPNAACFVVPRVGSWDEFRAARGSATIDWTTLTTRTRAAIFIPSDVAPQEARDCLHEELAQALGPLNDLYHLSDSVFNDDNFNTVLTGFDMLVMRTTYAPELRSGMSRAEVSARLPGILARLNPAGGGAAGAGSTHTPRDWISAIETALSPGSSDSARRAGAARALSLAQSYGWSDNRRAFSHFVFARLSMASQVEQSVIHFAEAGRFYAGLPGGTLHQAHVDMQMAAFALTSGQYDQVLRLTDRAMPPMMREQNAAVLATLKMLRAEALEASGRSAEAAATRLDSLGWARYGFGSETQVQARLREVANLAPGRVASRN